MISDMADLVSKAEEAWKNSKALSCALISLGAILALWAGLTNQSPGVSIGLLALVAGVMSLRPEMRLLEKAAWVVILVAFTVLEVRAINRNDEENRKARDRQNESFNAIVQKLESSARTSEGQYASTISHVDDVLGTTESVANLAKESLEDITGGNSFAYLAPQPATEGGGVPLAIVNPGRYPLTGVTVTVRDVTEYPFRTYPTLSVGTLASHVVRQLDFEVKPIPGTDPAGVASFDITIFAQNGESNELLQFRRGKRVLWDHRAQVSRSVPAPFTMVPQHPKAKSDIPGFRLSYDWLEDKLTTDRAK